jgi:predicted nucleic acid-binding protein
MAFWDTSALVKLYVRERDSDYFREMMRTSAEIPIISELTLAEMHRALWAKELGRAIPEHRAVATYRQFRSDVESANLEIVPFGRDVQREFDRIVQICHRSRLAVPIRTLDGLLLASALTSRVGELISTDSRMRDAGMLLGLAVLPGSYPHG